MDKKGRIGRKHLHAHNYRVSIWLRKNQCVKCSWVKQKTYPFFIQEILVHL